ncbi:unnamed protein product, partial [Polarella glacialis]
TAIELPAAVHPRPPPEKSAARIRAQILLGLKQEDSDAMRKLIDKAILDPEKADLNRWIRKYMLRPELKNNSALQDLQLLIRRHCRGDLRQPRVV